MNKKGPVQPDDKEQIRPSGFPHYPRLFTALPIKHILGVVSKTLLWIALISGVSLGSMVLDPTLGERLDREIKRIGYHAESKNQNTAVLGITDNQVTDKNSLQTKYDYWQGVIRDHPDYRDGYYMAAMISYEIGNMNESQRMLNKVKSLDPNFSGIPVLEALLPEE